MRLQHGRVVGYTVGYGLPLTDENKVWRFWLRMAKAHGVELHEVDRVLPAYVNHGRWVANCPVCNGGIMCPEPSLRGRRGACLDCGSIFRIDYPVGWRLIEAALNQRPDPVNRNWLLGETLAHLIAENQAHSVAEDG